VCQTQCKCLRVSVSASASASIYVCVCASRVKTLARHVSRARVNKKLFCCFPTRAIRPALGHFLWTAESPNQILEDAAQGQGTSSRLDDIPAPGHNAAPKTQDRCCCLSRVPDCASFCSSSCSSSSFLLVAVLVCRARLGHCYSRCSGCRDTCAYSCSSHPIPPHPSPSLDSLLAASSQQPAASSQHSSAYTPNT
jgi:hypothetical protein